jgi:hypothetical protein
MDINFLNFWSLGWNAGRNFETMDDLDTRGGPPIVEPAMNYLNVAVVADAGLGQRQRQLPSHCCAVDQECRW